MNKKSYVYKITCKITGEFYFGSSFNAKSDYYWGGGTKIRERIAQYGKENFIKEILGEFDDRTESNRVENDYIEQFRHDEKCLNKRIEYHFGAYGEESSAKKSAALRGEKAPWYGKHLTDEMRAKIGAANAINKRGENHPMYGKHHTEETRSKISAALRGEKSPCYRKHWRKNPVTGKREWYD